MTINITIFLLSSANNINIPYNKNLHILYTVSGNRCVACASRFFSSCSINQHLHGNKIKGHHIIHISELQLLFSIIITVIYLSDRDNFFVYYLENHQSAFSDSHKTLLVYKVISNEHFQIVN